MPGYDYYDEETGLRIHVRRLVEDRDKPIILRRASKIPEKLNVMVPGATPDGSFNETIKRAYYKKEEREGSRFRSEHSKSKIKRVWSN